MGHFWKGSRALAEKLSVSPRTKLGCSDDKSPFFSYRVDDGEEPVHGHEDESVDAEEVCGVDEVLDRLAPEEAEGPSLRGGEGVVDAGEGDAEDDEEEVGQRQAQDEHVGRVAHLLVGHHHRDHKQVPDYA